MATKYLLRKVITPDSKGVSMRLEVPRIEPKEYEVEIANVRGVVAVKLILGRTNSSLGYYNGQTVDRHMPYSPAEQGIELYFKSRSDFESYFSKK